MTIVRVNLGDHSYDICVGQGLLSRLDEFLRPLGLGRRLALVTHPVLRETHDYADTVVRCLSAAGYDVSLLTIPPGEESKSLLQAERLWRDLAQAGLDRSSAVLALGGGVIGDLGGFVAATLYRGIRFVTLPTTLLAQVDSSVGGKTEIGRAHV